MATKSMDLGQVMGTSAYQAAQAGGYTGTQTEFNSALKEVSGHIDNNDIHVTAEQKTAWTGSVRYDAAQSLTDDHKTQARGNINAAPGGFGLGELTGRTANSFADITGYGFYRVPSESGFAPDTSSNWGAVYIGANLSYGILLYARNNALMAVRAVSSGEIGPIEWVNPPMDLGVEYRTTERFFGRPVYYKIVDCGQIADNKQVEHGIANMRDCISFQGLRGGMPMPSISNNNLSAPWSYYVADVDRAKITLACGTSAAGGNCHVILKYTKTTD